MDISFSSGCKKPRARTVLCTKALGDGHAFIADREEHPSNECGNGSQCAIDDSGQTQHPCSCTCCPTPAPAPYCCHNALFMTIPFICSILEEKSSWRSYMHRIDTYLSCSIMQCIPLLFRWTRAKGAAAVFW